jgi:hypothetical protein
VIGSIARWQNWKQSFARDLIPDEGDIVAKFSM